MADSFLPYQDPSVVDKKLDTEALAVGANTVHRERIQIAGTTDTAICPVSATDGLLVNLGANNDVTVTGSVTANAGTNLNTSALALESGGNLATIAGAVRAEDAASSDGHTGVGALAVRKATPANTSGADGDYEFLQMSAGRLWVDPSGVTLTVASHAVTNAGTFAVQNVNQTGDNTIGRVKITDGTDVADVLDLTNSNPIAVAIVDGSGDQISSFGGGTQYTEDAAAAANPVGTALNLVRADTPAGITTADGDNVAARGTDYGALYATLLTAGGVPIATGSGNATGTLRVELANNGTGVLATVGAVTAISNALPAGTNNIGDVDVLSVVPGVGATNLGKAIDTATGATDTGVLALATRNDTLATLTPVDGDNVQLRTTSTGRLWTSATVDAALPAGTNAIGKLAANSGVDIGDVDVTTVGTITPGTAASSLGKAEDAAHGSGDVGVMALAVANEANTQFAADADYVPLGTNREGSIRAIGSRAHDAVDADGPVKVGHVAIAHGTNPTAVAAADRTNWYANRAGIPFMLGGHPNVITVEAAYTAAQTDAAIVTISTGLKIVVTQIQMTADNANTVDVGFRVGFGTANTPTTTGVVLTHPGVAAGSGISRGDGSGIIGVGADNEDLRITSEVPTTGSIRILVSYFTIET